MRLLLFLPKLIISLPLSYSDFAQPQGSSNAPIKKHSNNPLQELGEGIVKGATDMIKAVAAVVIHPVGSLKDMGQLIAHPIREGNNIEAAIKKECHESGWKCAGDGIFLVGTALAGGEAFEAVGVSAQLAEAGELVTHADEAALAGNPTGQPNVFRK